MDPGLSVPRRIKAPGTIGLIAPSGCISDPEVLDAGIANIEARGWRVKQGANIRKQWKYFSATDTERLAELHAMAADPEVDVVMSVRGGYGLTRLLDRIDYTALAASGKVFVGFSDFTALNLALVARASYVSLSGPMARVDFGEGEICRMMEDNFWPLLSEPTHTTPDIFCSHDYAQQSISGTLWGTNISLVCNLLGTPYFPNIRNGILLAEDIGEEPYHIERCFIQLKHAGVLDQQRAIVLGTFNGFEADSEVAKRLSMDDVAQTLRQIAPCPVLTGFPFGHCAEKITVPVGAQAELRISTQGYRLTLRGYNQ